MQIADWIEAKILGVHKEIHVAQYATTSPFHDKLRNSTSSHRRMAKTQVSCGVLDQKPAVKRVLRLADMGAEEIERLVGVRSGSTP